MKNATIYPVQERKNDFVVKNVTFIQCSTTENRSIRKTVILGKGFSKVTGLKSYEVKNKRFDASRVGTVNSLSGTKYTETEFITLTEWIFE